MTTLFSPVGTADPITQLGDGPMLHIVRHYKPEKVVIFLSPKMQEYQDRDERYSRAIERLCEAEQRNLPEVVLHASSFADVFRFDHYIEEFEQILKGLCDESSEEPVLVNASSGTPAMEQSLVALCSFGRLPLKLLQVPTPKKGPNSPEDREKPDTYDFEFMWEINEELRRENPEACVSRVIETETPNFANRVMRENIITLVQHHEYEAAYALACGSTCIEDGAILMIRAAADRLNLDGTLPAKAFAKTRIAYRPDDLLGEYLSVMEVRLKQGHWADFVRLLSPALTQFDKITLRKNGLPEGRYLKLDNKGRRTDEVDWDAVEKDEKLSRVFGASRNNRPRYISNGMLASLIEEYCEDDDEKQMLLELRRVEDKCRNRLAHTITASSKASLERIGGLSLDGVLEHLFTLHGNMRQHLYTDISQVIIDQL